MMRRSSVFVLVGWMALTMVSCANESFEDDFGGVIDLGSGTAVYGSSTNKTAGVPTSLAPAKGFVAGSPAEFYDFGTVPVQTKPDPAGGSGTVPDYAFAYPIYFFYDEGGHPMFSVPARDERSGRWVMPGGNPTLGPNQTAGADRRIPFSLRPREKIVDPKRHSMAHQRPIVDAVPIFSSTNYSGFWELVEVHVANGYVPDSIKSLKTLTRAVDAGSATLRSTGLVVNCPLVDERTAVTPSLANWAEPAPLIEIWYRRKLGYCLLANGYRSLAKDGVLLAAGSPDRVQTMQQRRVEIKGGTERRTRLALDAEMLLTPTIPGKTPFDPSVPQPPITAALPVAEEGVEAAYTALRYPWTVKVPLTMPPTPVPTDMASVDPSWLARPATVEAKNFSLLGMIPTCGAKTTAADGSVSCGDDAPTCPEGLLCNAATCACDLPAVGYGDLCAPGVARCKATAEMSDEEKAFAPKGFLCFPSARGFCLPKCDATVNDGVDDCPVPGFDCQTPRSKAVPTDSEKKSSLCLRSCDLTRSASLTTRACREPSGITFTEASGGTQDLADRLVCQNQRNVTACFFDDALEPH